MKIKIVRLFIIIIFTTIFSSCEQPKELKQGKNIAEEGYSWVILQDDNKFIFNVADHLSYRPIGDYSIENDKLILQVTDYDLYYNEYIFKIKNSQLIFQSASGNTDKQFSIKKGTIFTLSSE